MALTGHLSDLSLSELIEFFCNQRKSGRLKVLYPQGPGYFNLQAGSVVDAQIGVLRGIDAVYYALTLPNANFEFDGSVDVCDRSINQPWTQVVLEGLRRLDEGVTPSEAFPASYIQPKDELESSSPLTPRLRGSRSHVPSFLAFINKGSAAKRRPMVAALVVLALVSSVAVIGIPAGWYKGTTASMATSEPVASAETLSQPVSEPPADLSNSEAPEAKVQADEAAAFAARRRERDRAKARQEKAAILTEANASSSSADTNAPVAPNIGPKKVSVTVTYDESGRVVQASGGDPSALRIARQKRFPPGKAGSATVTIPIN